MNIKIVDSWLRDYLKTKATAYDVARELSLASVSVDRVDKAGEDFIYDIEITTNRPDLMSIIGLAREAAAILPQFRGPARRRRPPAPSPRPRTTAKSRTV